MDPDTAEPLDTLAPLAQQAIEALGSRCTTVSGVIDSKDRAVFSAITEGLERANKHATSNAQKACHTSTAVHVCLFDLACLLLSFFLLISHFKTCIYMYTLLKAAAIQQCKSQQYCKFVV